MTATKKMTTFKWALVLAVVLALTGSASAKKASSGPGVAGDLSDDRTSVIVSVTSPACVTDPLATQPAVGALSVYIFQSVGRLINIGTSNTSVTCNGATSVQDVTVNAIPGLSFQPGPATLLIRFTTVDPLTLQPTVSESGSRIDLRP